MYVFNPRKVYDAIDASDDWIYRENMGSDRG